MKQITSLFLVILLIFLLVACNLPTEPEKAGSSQQTGDQSSDNEDDEENIEEQDVTFDYCSLPAGTRLKWFDLSTFIFIPASGFQMGFDEADQDADYEPSHPVNLSAYWLHETEVTNRQYANCVAAGICARPASRPDVPYWYKDAERLEDPVVGVTWEEADAYCEWIGTRLPTEAEWEFAARGTDSIPYPWGSDDPTCDLANYEDCLTPEDSQPVFANLLEGGKSPLEILGLTGNANEWVSDWYADDYYQNSPSSNPTGPETGSQRSWRGGSYLSSSDMLQAYLRGALEPDQHQPDLGFRCAWSCGENVPPQVCQLPPIIAGDVQAGGVPETSPPELKGEGYCEWRGRVQSAGIVISASEGVDLSQYNVSGLGGASCTMQGDLLVCSGGAISPNSSVSLQICPECAPGSYFNPGSGFCQQMVDTRSLVTEDEDDESSDSVPEISLISPAECPAGAVEVDGQCLVELVTGCPPGTIEVEGNCVSKMTIVCPPGTVEVDGQCVGSQTVECPPGTVEVDGQCVGSQTVECPPGTIEVDGKCVIELIVECPPGTIEINGSCWPTGKPDFELPICAPFYYKTENCGCIPVNMICLSGSGSTLEPKPQESAFEPGMGPLDWLPKFPLSPEDLGPNPDHDPDECIGLEALDGCPPTTIPQLFNGCWTCTPLNLNPGCPVGYAFNPETSCCIPNHIPPSSCPFWTYYDPITHSCIPIVFEGRDCFEITVTVPGCGPRPSQEKPDDVPKDKPDCSTYSNQSSCESNSCKWVEFATTPGGTCEDP